MIQHRNRRLVRELQYCLDSAEAECMYIVHAHSDNMDTWSTWLRGAVGSPYDGGVWELAIEFPPTFPMQPPTVRFVTPVYHVNICIETGAIRLDLLESMWSPALMVNKLLVALQSLLMDPTPDESCWAGDALMTDMCRLCESNRALYDQMARKCTQRLASDTLISVKRRTPKSQQRVLFLLWIARELSLLYALPLGALEDAWIEHILPRAAFYPYPQFGPAVLATRTHDEMPRPRLVVESAARVSVSADIALLDDGNVAVRFRCAAEPHQKSAAEGLSTWRNTTWPLPAAPDCSRSLSTVVDQSEMQRPAVLLVASMFDGGPRDAAMLLS